MATVIAQAQHAPTSNKLSSWLLQLATILGLVAGWGIAAELMNNPAVLPSPAGCVRAIGNLIARGTLLAAAQSSFTTLLIGSGLCIIGIIPATMLIALNRRAASLIQPMVRFISCVPAIALIPLFIVWFGFSQRAVYATLIYTSAIPLLFSVLTGVQKIPPVYASSLRTLGASTGRIIRDVYLPGAIPGIVVGIRLTLSYGWRAVIAGELIVGSSGLGRLLAQSRASNQVDQIMAAMIVICVLYLVIDRLFLHPWDQVVSSR